MNKNTGSFEYYKRVRDTVCRKDSGFSGSLRMVALAIADHMDGAGEAYPSIRELSEWTDLDRRTIERAVDILTGKSSPPIGPPRPQELFSKIPGGSTPGQRLANRYIYRQQGTPKLISDPQLPLDMAATPGAGPGVQAAAAPPPTDARGPGMGLNPRQETGGSAGAPPAQDRKTPGVMPDRRTHIRAHNGQRNQPPTPSAGAEGGPDAARLTRRQRINRARDYVLDAAQALGLVLTDRERRRVRAQLENGFKPDELVSRLRAQAEAETRRDEEPDPSLSFAAPPQDPTCVPVWDQVAAQIQQRVNRHFFATWFRPLVPVCVDPGAQLLRVHAPNGHFEDWINRNYAPVIAEAVSAAGLDPLRVEVLVFRDRPPPVKTAVAS